MNLEDCKQCPKFGGQKEFEIVCKYWGEDDITQRVVMTVSKKVKVIVSCPRDNQ